jgi:hypothetical protein
MHFLTPIYNFLTSPFRLLFKFLIEMALPDPIKETIVIVSLYAILKDINDPCVLDFNKIDKEILDRLIVPEAIKLPILCAPYIWSKRLTLLLKLKTECSQDTSLEDIKEYADDIYRSIPFYLRYNARKIDTIMAIERVICLTCNVPACVVADTTPQNTQYHSVRGA